MKCPKCKSTSTRVTCTKHQGNETKRYCRCLDCEKRYITIETYLVPVREIHPRQIKRGEENNFAVLTEQNVRDIRQLAQEYTYKVIAKRYGIHPQTVYRIVKAKRWAHIKDTPAL
jgi:Mg2+ and Co2+ transporter CorA